jgi:hypothetical protein
MRRIHFIELHEQPWFPSSLRDEITVLRFRSGSISSRPTLPSPRCFEACLTTRGTDQLLICVQAVEGPGWTFLEGSEEMHRPPFKFGLRINTQTSQHSEISERLLRITSVSILTQLMR